MLTVSHVLTFLDREFVFGQARNQGGGEVPLEKCVGHNLKLLDTIQKIWPPLRKLFAPPGIPSWLRACVPPSEL